MPDSQPHDMSFLSHFRSIHKTAPPTLDPNDKDKDKETETDNGAKGNGKKKEKPPRRKIRWGSIAYQLSFSFFILLISVLLAGSGWGLSEQALRGGAERLNIFIVLAAYVFFFISSIAHIWSRVLSVKRILRTMPKPYVPTKAIDLPNKVADHIMIEYSRTAVVAHISQPTKGKQEGWGRPGTKWENQHLRTYILSTVPKLQKALLPNRNPSTTTTSRAPVLPVLEMTSVLPRDGIARVIFNTYVLVVKHARYARTEPSEEDAANAEYTVTQLPKLVDIHKAKRKAELLENGRIPVKDLAPFVDRLED